MRNSYVTYSTATAGGHGENVDTKTDHDRDWGGLRLRAGGTAAESRGREGEDDACEWEF